VEVVQHRLCFEPKGGNKHSCRWANIANFATKRQRVDEEDSAEE